MKKLLFLIIIASFIFCEKKFVITIDDVPTENFETVISFLETNHYFSILFVTEYIEPLTNFDFKKITINKNFIIGNHTSSHNLDLLKYSSWHVIKRDLMPIHSYFKTNFNYTIKLYRTPYGYCNNKNLQAILRMNYDILPWDPEIPNENKYKNKTNVILDKEELVKYFDYHFPYKRNICVLLFHINSYILTNLKVIFEAIEEYGKVATKKDFYNNYNLIVK